MNSENPTEPSRPPRLVDIAAIAGVHLSIVSRVLNEDPALSARSETRERVKAIANELGYRPNAAGKGLRTATVGALGLVLPSLRNPVWSQVMRGVLDVAEDLDIAVLIAEVSDEEGSAESYRRLVGEGRVDGLLLASAERPSVDALIDARTPIVYINRGSGTGAVNVVMDEPKAVKLVSHHLKSHGHRRLVHIDGPTIVDTVRRRLSALAEIWNEETQSLTVINAAFTERGGYEAIQALLPSLLSPDPPTALAVAGFPQLVGALSALRERRLDVPAKVSLITYDEDPILDYLDMKITSVSMPLRAMGTVATRSLVRRINGETVVDVQVSDPMALVVRGSVATIHVPRDRTLE